MEFFYSNGVEWSEATPSPRLLQGALLKGRRTENEGDGVQEMVQRAEEGGKGPRGCGTLTISGRLSPGWLPAPISTYTHNVMGAL